MNIYNTIKEIVLDTYASEGTMPSYEKLTALVLKHFPNSRWQKSHYAWYKSQISTGKISVTGATPSDASDNIDIDKEIEESISIGVSMEKDLQRFLSANLKLLEPGLALATNGIEHTIEAGRIDILAVDSNQNQVVIETKAHKANDAALGQLLGYMGCLAKNDEVKSIRGILVAAAFDQRVIFAASNLENISLVKYKLDFNFETI